MKSRTKPETFSISDREEFLSRIEAGNGGDGVIIRKNFKMRKFTLMYLAIPKVVLPWFWISQAILRTEFFRNLSKENINT